jgi:glycosyltransferase involved in cell wall biosynthesis
MNVNNITIVIPALNEGQSIANVVRNLIQRFGSPEILVINDGSEDNTEEEAQKAGARVINHIRNRGYGWCLRTGTLASERDYVLFCDADGQHTAEDVERVANAIDGFDMVVGKRGNDSHISLLRVPGKFILRKFADFLAGERIPDLNSGLRIIRRKVLLKYLHLMPNGFSFSTTSTFALLKGNYSIKWVPITAGERRIGKSTVRQLKHGPQTLMLILRLTVLFEPLKIFLLVTKWLALFSLISLGVDIAQGGDTGLSDTTVLLSISTLIIFMFGLLCDQVSSLRREIHD